MLHYLFNELNNITSILNKCKCGSLWTTGKKISGKIAHVIRNVELGVKMLNLCSRFEWMCDIVHEFCLTLTHNYSQNTCPFTDQYQLASPPITWKPFFVTPGVKTGKKE